MLTTTTPASRSRGWTRATSGTSPRPPCWCRAPGSPRTRVQAVHGPEDLTFEQVAEIVSTATGREVKVQLVPDEEQRAGLLEAGLPPAAADGMVGMLAGTRDGFVPEQPRDVLSTTPTTLAAWASAVLRPALDAA